jgi:hypothetical protein
MPAVPQAALSHHHVPRTQELPAVCTGGAAAMPRTRRQVQGGLYTGRTLDGAPAPLHDQQYVNTKISIYYITEMNFLCLFLC